MSETRGIDAACLVGITSGYLVDPKSSQAVLRVLSQALGIEVDTQALDEHAAELEKVVAKLQQMQQMQESMNRGDEDLRYIGWCDSISPNPAELPRVVAGECP